MRWALLLALAACGDDECTPLVGSRLSYEIGMVSSGKQLAGVAWIEKFNKSAPLQHVALVRPDGTLSPDVPSRPSYGVAGTRSVLWHRDASDECDPGARLEFKPVLYDGTNTTGLTIAPVTRGHTAVFDGTRYQLFWTDPMAKTFHATLDEDGTLGAVHDLALANGCVSAATDGAGSTIIRSGDQIFVVDDAGAKRLVWTATVSMDRAPVFFFAGKFHIVRFDAIWSVDPVTGLATRQVPEANALTYLPTATKLFASTLSDIVEIDASFKIIAHTPRRGTNMRVGTIGDELLFITQRPLDMADFDGPTRITVERNNQTTELAVDSPTETLDTCQ